MVFATRNAAKLEQVRPLFADWYFKLVSQTEVGVLGEGQERRDSAATLFDNARIKARYVFDRLGKKQYVVADDSGVFIRALDGEPGAHTRYWGGENLTVGETVRYALARMQEVDDRYATFRSVIVLVSPNGEEETFQGDVNGFIAYRPCGSVTKGLPFNQIFRPLGRTKTFAEMEPSEVNQFSHRGRAFANMIRALKMRSLQRV